MPSIKKTKSYKKKMGRRICQTNTVKSAFETLIFKLNLHPRIFDLFKFCELNLANVSSWNDREYTYKRLHVPVWCRMVLLVASRFNSDLIQRPTVRNVFVVLNNKRPIKRSLIVNLKCKLNRLNEHNLPYTVNETGSDNLFPAMFSATHV